MRGYLDGRNTVQAGNLGLARDEGWLVRKAHV